MADLQMRLESSSGGLSEAKARNRLIKNGPNEIEERKSNLFLKFLGYFWGPIPWTGTWQL
jgi:H+-transporting ATPase